METLQAKFDRVTDIVTDLRELSERVDTVVAEAPLVNWDDRLKTYLKELKKEEGKKTTWRTKRGYLNPWVKWLWKHGLRPTSQRIKQYLTENKNLAAGSYDAIGKVIKDFTNYWSETWNEVKLVKALGQKPEKATLTMP